MAVDGRPVDRAHAPRTITVRVRAVVIVGAIVVSLLAVVAATRYVTGLQPLAGGSLSVSPQATMPLPHTDDTASPVYRWRRGARIIYTLHIENTSRLPITVTGVDGTPRAWVGPYTGPRAALGNEREPARPRPFRPMHLAAGESGALALVFTANPRACANPGNGTTSQSSRDVTIRFTVAGVVDNTQVVPLAPDHALAMRQPTRADCRR